MNGCGVIKQRRLQNHTYTLCLSAVLGVLLVAPSAFSQAIASDKSATSGGNANAEISLDLVVHDRKNKPVLDLTAADFTVTDNESPVTLTRLRLNNGNSSKDQLITLLFDPLQPVPAKNATNVVAKILSTFPSKGFSFAVLNVEGRLRLFRAFSDDRKAIQKAAEAAADGEKIGHSDAAAKPEKELLTLARTGTDASGNRVDVKEHAKAKMLLTALEQSQKIVQDQHAQPALAGLLALAQAQQQSSGRKTIIYFAQSKQMDLNSHDLMKSIVGAANQAGVTIYTVDLNGLDNDAQQQLLATSAMGAVNTFNSLNPQPTGQATLPTGGVGPGLAAQANNFASRIELDVLNGNVNPMVQLAIATGGTYIDAQDSIRKPLERMLEDMTTYYEASYVAAIKEYDGKFRPVAFKPLRTGLNVRARAGYFALPSGYETGIRPFEAPLVKMLAQPQLPNELEFQASILSLGALPDGNANELVIAAPLSELELKEDNSTNLYSTHVSIMAQIKDKDGQIIEHFSEDIPRHGSLTAIESARSEASTLQRHFLAGPGKYTLEAAVMDQNGGKAGAKRVEFEIPQTPAGPSLSDMILVRSVETVRGESDSEEPMLYANSKVTPNISGSVPPTAKDVSLFFILHPQPGTSDPAKLQMEVARDGQPAGNIALPLKQDTAQGAVPYLATFPTSALGPGDYMAKATISQGGKSSTRQIAFTVAGGHTASESAAVSASGSSAAADEKLGSPASEPHITGSLLISAPTSAQTPPAPEERAAMIADARHRALSYSDSLPNFFCVEVTNRSIDSTGNGAWKHKDKVAELLRYRDKTETRTTLEVDGKKSNLDREAMKGPFSSGQFGGVLNAVFEETAKADFQWKETDTLGSGTVQVFSYRVPLANSSFNLTGSDNRQIKVGFHGAVYIDSATRSVRRITLIADDLPKNFSIRASSIGVDYDYIAINDHDYLMPVTGQVSLQQGHKQALRNEIEFRGYKRYGSDSRLLPVGDDPANPYTNPSP